MNALLALVVYADSNGTPLLMPVEMISAYAPYTTHLTLDEAARTTNHLDEVAAMNLENDFKEYSMSISEGTGFDELSIEAPSLR